MATETQTAIETLKRAQIYNCRSADPEHCKLPICADARTALEDVEALVALMQRIGYDEELSYLACPGPPNCDGSHYDTCPVALARTAVVKFQVKS